MGLIICEKKEEVLMNFITRRDVFMLEKNVTSEEKFLDARIPHTNMKKKIK